jgi:hypothetical protein
LAVAKFLAVSRAVLPFGIVGYALCQIFDIAFRWQT